LGGLAMLLLSLLLLLLLPLGMDPTVGYDSIRYGTIRMDLGEARQCSKSYIISMRTTIQWSAETEETGADFCSCLCIVVDHKPSQ
jgi:hypothetical protein